MVAGIILTGLFKCKEGVHSASYEPLLILPAAEFREEGIVHRYSCLYAGRVLLVVPPTVTSLVGLSYH